MKKLNVKNIVLVMMMLLATGWLIGDLILITFYGASYTWFGLITAGLNVCVIGLGGDYLNEYVKKL